MENGDGSTFTERFVAYITESEPDPRSGGLGADKCGCYGDSGPYTSYCNAHNPELMLQAAVAEVERLRARVRELEAR